MLLSGRITQREREAGKGMEGDFALAAGKVGSATAFAHCDVYRIILRASSVSIGFMT